MMRDIKNQKRKRYQPQSGPSHGELKWPTKTDSIPFCVSLTQTGWRAMKPEPRRQMTCFLAECRNGMTGYQTTPPCNIADNSMLFAQWSGNWSQRCAGTLSTSLRPKDGANPDAADVLMGMYRTDMRHNTAKIAVNVGVREQIESGVGAWRLVTQYEDNDPTSNNQVIRRLPIHEPAHTSYGTPTASRWIRATLSTAR